MANAIKWEAAFTSRSTVFTTELNSLAAATWKGPGTEIDNSTNLDTYGKLEINLEYASAPAAGASISIAMVTAPDGTNYESESATEEPGNHNIIATIPVILSADAKRYMSGIFPLQPCKISFYFYNGGSTALEATGNTVELFTCNEEIQ